MGSQKSFMVSLNPDPEPQGPAPGKVAYINFGVIGETSLTDFQHALLHAMLHFLTATVQGANSKQRGQQTRAPSHRNLLCCFSTSTGNFASMAIIIITMLGFFC